MSHVRSLMSALIGLAITGSALGAVSQEQAAALGNTLTPWGAEIAGNAEGTIPAYTGGITAPAGYDPAKPGIRPDPFANEQPVISITAANMAQHADKLTAGTQAMLQKYPTFRVDVYPTHRSVRYPEFYQRNSVKNATECKTTDDGLRISGCWAGAPFPIPQTGVEVMWNRYLKYERPVLKNDEVYSHVVDASGTVIMTASWNQRSQYPLWLEKQNEPLKGDEISELLRTDYTGPTRKNGEKLVIQDGIDMVNSARRAWSYMVGQRRVKLSPDVAYDTPSPTGAGVTTVDDSMVFFGAFDRYDFKLVGKKEMYIPYNMFKIQDESVCGKEVVLTKNHMNPECVRWELHRVWVVEATLKNGKRHIYPTRTFYWDEDALGIGMSDDFDATGKIYRVVHSESFPVYESDGHVGAAFAGYDLATGAYTRQSYSGSKSGWYSAEPMPLTTFSAQALTGGGVR